MSIRMTATRPFLAAIFCASFAVGISAPLAAWAELSNDTLLGPGLRSRPVYDGSSSQRTEWVPVVRYYGDTWFVRSTQGVLEGGARWALAPGLHAGVQMGFEPGRKSSESDFLSSRGLPDLEPGASVGAHLEWDHKIGPMPLTLLARTRQYTDSARGAQADLRLSAGVFQSGRLAAGIFTQGTWADAKSTNSIYGITPQQSASTGLAAFNAGSGGLFYSAGLIWSLDLGQNWIVVGSLESRHLRGDAVASPLTLQTSNSYVSAGLAYRF